MYFFLSWRNYFAITESAKNVTEWLRKLGMIVILSKNVNNMHFIIIQRM